jgi:hypothetical protein
MAWMMAGVVIVTTFFGAIAFIMRGWRQFHM